MVLAAACLAQEAAGQTAVVTTSVNNGGTATIEPGETVSVSVRIAHDRYAFANIQGGTVVDGNAGVGSNFATTIPNLPTVVLGSFVGGSRVGADIAFGLDPMGGATPPSQQNPMPVWTYDITLHEPGVYEIVWVSPATRPNVLLWGAMHAFSLTEAQTTYVGATITVVPGAPTAGVVGAFGLLAARRMRGGGR